MNADSWPTTFGILGFLDFIWDYPLASGALMVVNLIFIIHALKTGRPYYWVWIIFMMPVIGAAAYFFVEMRPKLPRCNWQSIQW